MPRTSTDLIEQFARTHERDVKRTLRRHYGAKLSAEDIGDVLQDTYLAASAAVARPDGPRDLPALRMWFYGAVRHKAIDAIRGVEGRRYTRDRDASYDALTEQGAAIDPAVDDAHAESLERVDAPVRAQDVALVHDAFRRLPSQHRELLRLTDMDEDPRSLRDAAALLGKSKSELARQRTRALGQLSVMVGRAQGSNCVRARSLRGASGDSLAWRDAHLADCLCCQVSYGRRVQVLLPFLPLAMPGRTARVGHALASLLGRGDVPAEAVAAGVAAGSGAGLLGGGAGAKLAACAAAGVAAIACAAGAPRVAAPDEPAPVVRSAVAPRSAAASPQPARVAFVTEGESRRLPVAAPARPRRERRAAAPPALEPAGEFAPESFAPAARPAATATTPVATVSTAPDRTAPSSPSGFSEEFSP